MHYQNQADQKNSKSSGEKLGHSFLPKVRFKMVQKNVIQNVIINPCHLNIYRTAVGSFYWFQPIQDVFHNQRIVFKFIFLKNPLYLSSLIATQPYHYNNLHFQIKITEKENGNSRKVSSVRESQS